MDKPSLDQQRHDLIARCAVQRADLADELRALRPSAAVGDMAAANPTAVRAMEYVNGHRKLALSALGVVVGLALFQRKSLAGAVTSAMSGWKLAQSALSLMGRYR